MTNSRYFDTASKEVTEALRNAPIYEKSAIVTMRIATPGEKLSTVLSSGALETTRTLMGGECIVKNPLGEEYAISEDKFLSRYEKLANGNWKAIGEIRAIKNPTEFPITIMAPWGEEQKGDENCFIASNSEVTDDRYLIGFNEFHSTYKLKVS